MHQAMARSTLYLVLVLVVGHLAGFVAGADQATPNYGRYGNSLHCHREPTAGVVAKKSYGDGNYKIKISGNPEKYTPGEVYTGKF